MWKRLVYLLPQCMSVTLPYTRPPLENVVCSFRTFKECRNRNRTHFSTSRSLYISSQVRKFSIFPRQMNYGRVFSYLNFVYMFLVRPHSMSFNYSWVNNNTTVSDNGCETVTAIWFPTSTPRTRCSFDPPMSIARWWAPKPIWLVCSHRIETNYGMRIYRGSRYPFTRCRKV